MEISKAQKSDIPEILALQKAAFLPIAAVREGAIPPVFFAVGLGRKSAVSDIYFSETKKYNVRTTTKIWLKKFS
mgnify:CR=1 FL=1